MAISRDTLITYLRDKLKVKVDKIDDRTALFSSGKVDSFAMVDLIVFLETEGGFKIDANDVKLENLDTIESILSFMADQPSHGA